jgi:apolipoprotein D and lipocalin family protein
MKYILFLFIVTFTYASSPKAVTYVDANRFSGLWYEIARTYNSFEKDCVAASVEYTIVEPYEYKINNRCFDTVIGAELIEYEGSAKASNDDKNINYLDMTYFWIFTKSYKVVYLESDYQKAIIVDNDMNSVWIMSRTPLIETTKLNQMVQFLSMYMDTSKLIYTPQDEQGRYK